MSALGTVPGLLDRLSVALDALRDALPSVALQAGGAVPFLAERTRVLESLHAVLDSINTQELDARRVLSGGVIEYRSPDQASALQEVLLALQHAWERRIASKLGPQRVAALLRLLETGVPDFLDLLGRVNDENANSDVLAWLLSPRHAPGIASATLHRLATFLNHAQEWQVELRMAIDANCLSVRRELVIGREWAEEMSKTA